MCTDFSVLLCYIHSIIMWLSHWQWFLCLLVLCHVQVGAVSPSPSFGAGSGDVPAESYCRHPADRKPHGEIPYWVPRSSALDEGCLTGTGPRYLQTTGKISQGQTAQNKHSKWGLASVYNMEVEVSYLCMFVNRFRPRLEEQKSILINWRMMCVRKW